MRFLVIGGHAVSAHGYPRFTKDLDLWVDLSPANAANIVAALKEFGLDFPGLSIEMFLAPDRMTQMGREPNRVDILTRIKGVEFGPCHARRQLVEIDGTQIPFIGRDDLISNKRATGRLQDLADVDQISKPPAH